ncbi:MAG: hypothetical protein ABIQ09_20040 [Jatrophihabitantaceae bacterium]
MAEIVVSTGRSRHLRLCVIRGFRAGPSASGSSIRAFGSHRWVVVRARENFRSTVAADVPTGFQAYLYKAEQPRLAR